MTTYKFEFRHRANASEAIEGRHEAFIEAIAELPSPWNLADAPLLPDIGAELVTTVSLDKVLPKGVKGRLTYSFRSEGYLDDDAQYDDTLFIEFKSGCIDIEHFASRIFTAYIKAFGCYRAALHDWTVTSSDWPEVVRLSEQSGKDINGRDGIYRINPINYFDELLCQRAFGMSAKAVANCLNLKIEKATEFENGVLLILGAHILDDENWIKLSDSIKLILGQQQNSG